VWCTGQTAAGVNLTLHIDGKPVGNAIDVKDPLTGGRIGLYLENHNSPPDDVATFSNFHGLLSGRFLAS
jgi:hypothetical protein